MGTIHYLKDRARKTESPLANRLDDLIKQYRELETELNFEGMARIQAQVNKLMATVSIAPKTREQELKDSLAGMKIIPENDTRSLKQIRLDQIKEKLAKEGNTNA